jgi:predicted aspartyl protease
MGRADVGVVIQKATLENVFDVNKFYDGEISKEQIRTVELDFLVDTGSAMICIAEKDALKLGLQVRNQKKVKTANGEVYRKIYSSARLVVQGRDTEMQVMGIPDEINAPPLLGYLPLEALDLHINPKEQILTGNPATDGKWFIDMY